MTPLFADTSYFVALLDRADGYHEEALEFSLANERPLLLTSAIVQELGAHFSAVQDRKLFRVILRTLQEEQTEVVRVDDALEHRGIDLFERRMDKAWSLADCISFVVMRDREMYEALTSDHHFEEAGFIALLRNPVQ